MGLAPIPRKVVAQGSSRGRNRPGRESYVRLFIMVHIEPLSTQPYICLPWTRMGAYHNDAARHPTVIDLGISRGLMAGKEAVAESWELELTAVTRLKKR